MSCPRLILSVLLLPLSCGCALLQTTDDTQTVDALSFHRTAESPAAASDVPVRKLVRMDAAVVVQPSSDQRIRELVWEELDESGLMSPADRQRLNRSGFRVGVSGMTLPWAVTSLVEEHQPRNDTVGNSPEVTAPAAVTQGTRFGASILIPEGSTSQLLLRADVDGHSVPGQTQPELAQLQSLENGRCLLHVEVVRYGEGWVVLKFLPQIHFGANTTRYSIEQGREQLSVRQRVMPLYEQQFEVKLHQDEAVVVGYRDTFDWSLGQLFFRSNSLTSTQERLLILRLSSIEEVVGQKDLTVQYSKY